MTNKPSGPRPPIHWHDDTPATITSAPVRNDHGHDHAEHVEQLESMGQVPDTDHVGHGRGHGLMMLACCVPMLLIAFALVASGVAGAGAILFALFCAAMMAAMMFAMPGHRH